MTFNTSKTNDLARLTLVAADQAYLYRENGVPVATGDPLAPLDDTPQYIDSQTGAEPQPPYDYQLSGFTARDVYDDKNTFRTGLKSLIYKNDTTGEVVVAFAGTDGPNFVDWWSDIIHLGWNQWDRNRDEVFRRLQEVIGNDVDLNTYGGRIDFAGQSLGGALAQYAAYDFVRQRTQLARAAGGNYTPSNITLTTFNALGGLTALRENGTTLAGTTGYDQSVLTGLASVTHYAVANDIVHLVGNGHAGGQVAVLPVVDFRPKRDGRTQLADGTPFQLGIVDAHRIEYGFYRGLVPLNSDFTRANSQPPTRYLHIDNLQKATAGFGNPLRSQTASNVEALIDLVAGSLPAMYVTSFAHGDQVNSLIQTLVEAAYNSGDIASRKTADKLADTNWAGWIGLFGTVAVASGLGAILQTYVASLLLGKLATGLGMAGHEADSALKNQFDKPSKLAMIPDQSFEQRSAQGDVLLTLLDPNSATSRGHADAGGLAQELASGSQWVRNSLDFMSAATRDAADLAPAQKLIITSLAADEIKRIVKSNADSDSAILTDAEQQIAGFFDSLGKALASTNPDLVAKFTDASNPLFDGQTLSFSEYDAYRNALAQLAKETADINIRSDLEAALRIVDSAGERPILATFAAKPTNPFNNPVFDPDNASAASDAIKDSGVGTYCVFLPYDARAGGQHIKLQLTGVDAEKFSVIADGEEIPIANGAFTLTVQEGRRQTSFALVATQDFAATGLVSIDATLVDASGEATHRTHHAADLAVEHEDSTFDKVVSGPFDTYPLGTRDVPPGSGFVRDPQTNELNNPGLVHTRLVGAAGADVIYTDHASELVEAGEGANYIFAGRHVGPASDPFRGADVIRAGSGNDLVIGDLGGARIAAGDGRNLVKPYDGPQFTIRGVLPDGSFFSGLSLDSVAHFYADFGAALKAQETGNGPVLAAQGNLELPVEVVFDLNGLSGNSQYFNFQPDSQADNAFPFIRRDPGGGSPYVLSANADGSATLTYSAGDRAAAFRIDIRNDAAPDALTPPALRPMSIEAGAGSDFLFGGEGRDVIRAGAGDDRIAGGGDDDTLLGEAGDDRIVAGHGDDYVDAGAGADQAWGEAGNDQLLGGAGTDQLFGGDGSDYLDGGAGTDSLFGDAGADELYGGEGNDFLAGGGADDRLYGELGDDTLEGDDGADLLSGGLGGDVLSGGDGDDVLDGGAGDDLLRGDGGNDELLGAEGNDALDGGDGDDTLSGDDGDDSLAGDGGEDMLDGGRGNDVLTGGEGNDTYVYRIGDGLDGIVDLSGNDQLELVDIAPSDVQLLPGSLFISVGAGQGIHIEGFDPAHALESGAIERFTFTATGDNLSLAELLENIGITLPATPDADVIQGTSARDNIAALGGDDLVFGNAGNDHIAGGAGNDELHGDQGNDVIDGGTGADFMIGGEGDDSYYVDDAADVVDETFGGGTDTVYASLTYALGANLENLQLAGFADIGGSGNDGDNQIFGNDGANRLSGLGGNDWLDGGAGSDLMAGGAGDDQYFVDTSLDVIVELADEGHDLVTATDSYVLPDQVEDLVLEGSFSQSGAVAALSGMGNALDNQIVGNDGDNVLDGRAGLDIVDGRAGNDVIFGGDGDDELFGGNDAIFSASEGGVLRQSLAPNADTIAGGAGNDSINGGSGDDQLFGEAGDDYLYGGNDGLVAGGNGGYGGYGGVYLSNNDLLDGGEGNDTLDGGSGDDRLLGGDGADALFGGADGFLNTSNNDYLDGGAGIDFMAGGTGNDIYIVDDARDSIVEYLGQGYDTVYSSADFALPDDVEELFLQEGSAARVARGNSADNVLHANSAGDRLEGGDGDDVLVGGAGEDVLVGGLGSNVYDFDYGSGRDTIYSDLAAFDTVRVGLDVSPANLSLARDGDDLTLRIVGTADRLRVAGWYGAGSGVATVEFADGTTWDAPAIAAAANAHVLIALDDAATVQEDVLLHVAGSVVGNDTGTGVIKPVTVLNPGNLSGRYGRLGLAADGSYAYDLFNDAVQFLGEGQMLHDVFAYRAEDAGGATSTALIDITILGANDVPVAVNDAATVQEDVALNAMGNVLTNDRDVDAGTKLAVFTPGSFAGAYGTLSLSADGSYTYTLANGSATVQQLRAGQTVSDVFGYAATDGIASAAGMLSVNVAGSNDAPVLANPLANQGAQAGTTFILAVPASTFTDVDKDDVLSYSARRADGAALPAWLRFDAATRTFSGTPATTDAGSLSVRLIASDIAGATADDVFSISVTGNRAFEFAVGGVWPRCDDRDDERERSHRSGNEHERDDDEEKCASHRMNVGSPGKPGTGEMVSIEGKNRTNGVYAGGAGADTLSGTSGADAFLLDDDLSARPPGTSGPRIVAIETINMGAGDDVVDLTSTRFTYGDATINGGAGNDVLWSNAGNDVLDGGAGDDSLAGGAGDDTYVHGSGAGNDVITETGGQDTIRFGVGIAPNAVRVSRHGKDLLLAAGGNGSVTVKNWFGARASRVERVQFADGTVWSEAQLSLRASASSNDWDMRSPMGGDDGQRGSHSGSSARESGEAAQGPGSKNKPTDAADIVAAVLAKKPSYDFSALADFLSGRYDDGSGRPLTAAEIAQKWRSLQRFTAYLAEVDPYAKEAAQGHGYGDDLLRVAAAAMGWGYESSIGQARAPSGMSTLQGLTEGFRKLR